MRSYFGHRLRILHWALDQSMTNALAGMELTAAQGRILAYLAHREDPPCSRDIEEAFQLTHPTVSGLLSRMEKKGFLQLRTDEADRRCRRIYILPKGLQCHTLMHTTILGNEEKLVEGFTPQEQEQFARLLDRAITNMGGNPCRNLHKEETEEHD